MGEPATRETSELIASDKVEGTAVYNHSGERLGSVYNFMVNKRSGQVAYAVLSFGGFLGMGSSYHPLPWNELTYDTSLGGYVVNRTKEQLERAPSYSASELHSWDDTVYGGRIGNYYAELGGSRVAPR
jgi:PRC-barrel domain